MASNLSQFHSVASQLPVHFDFENEKFDIRQIYQHYALKHERNPVSLFTDRLFANQLEKFAKDHADYEHLYVKTKTLAHFTNQSLSKA